MGPVFRLQVSLVRGSANNEKHVRDPRYCIDMSVYGQTTDKPIPQRYQSIGMD